MQKKRPWEKGMGRGRGTDSKALQGLEVWKCNFSLDRHVGQDFLFLKHDQKKWGCFLWESRHYNAHPGGWDEEVLSSPQKGAFKSVFPPARWEHNEALCLGLRWSLLVQPEHWFVVSSVSWAQGDLWAAPPFSCVGAVTCRHPPHLSMNTELFSAQHQWWDLSHGCPCLCVLSSPLAQLGYMAPIYFWGFGQNNLLFIQYRGGFNIHQELEDPGSALILALALWLHSP